MRLPAVDLLICQKEDPDIGQRLLLAAQTRGWSAPILLCKAYAASLATAAGTTEAVAAPLIIAAESEFRQQMELYGTALTQEDPITTLSEQGAGLAKQLLAAKQGIIVDVPVDLMKQIIDAAIDAVKSDYAAELAATVTYVRQQLQSHGITSPALQRTVQPNKRPLQIDPSCIRCSYSFCSNSRTSPGSFRL